MSRTPASISSPAGLTGLSRADSDDTGVFVGAAEVFVGFVLDAPPEECLTTVAGHAAKVEALGSIPAHAADFCWGNLMLAAGNQHGRIQPALQHVLRLVS